MTERQPTMRPPREWLLTQILVWAASPERWKGQDLDWDGLTDHLWGNWLMVEQDKMRQVLAALKLAQRAHDYHAAQDFCPSCEDIFSRHENPRHEKGCPLATAIAILEAALA